MFPTCCSGTALRRVCAARELREASVGSVRCRTISPVCVARPAVEGLASGGDTSSVITGIGERLSRLGALCADARCRAELAPRHAGLGGRTGSRAATCPFYTDRRGSKRATRNGFRGSTRRERRSKASFCAKGAAGPKDTRTSSLLVRPVGGGGGVEQRMVSGRRERGGCSAGRFGREVNKRAHGRPVEQQHATATAAAAAQSRHACAASDGERLRLRAMRERRSATPPGRAFFCPRIQGPLAHAAMIITHQQSHAPTF